MTQANNQVQGSNILDVLKKKMRATKEESERFKEECDEFQRKLLNETQRREDVSALVMNSLTQAPLMAMLKNAKNVISSFYCDLDFIEVFDSTGSWHFVYQVCTIASRLHHPCLKKLCSTVRADKISFSAIWFCSSKRLSFVYLRDQWELLILSSCCKRCQVK